jgi:MFS family permease
MKRSPDQEEASIELQVSKNIKMNYLNAGLMSLRLDWAVRMLFLGQRYMGLFEIGLIQSVSQFASMVSGTPAGAISDILGRKASAILSIMARAGGFIVVLTARDIVLFALGFALIAASQVLFSVTYESIAYDSLKITRHEHDYKKILGNLFVAIFIASSLGVAASGFVAERSFEWVYIASLVIVLLAIAPVLSFKETTRILNVKKERTSLKNHFSSAIGLVRTNPAVLYILSLGVIIYVVDNTIYSFLQKYFTDLTIPLYLLGIIFSIDQFCVAAGAKLSPMLDRFNVKDVVLVIPIMMLISYALLATINNVVSAVFLFLVAILVSMFYPIQSEIINSRITAESRATVLSFKSQLSSLGIMVLFPLVGFLAERSSLSSALLCLVLSALPIMLLLITKLRKMDLSKKAVLAQKEVESLS